MIFFNARCADLSSASRWHTLTKTIREHVTRQSLLLGRSFLRNVDFKPSRLHLLEFSLASFVFILNYRHYETLLDSTAQVRSRTKVFNPGRGFNPSYSLRFLWYSWSNFLAVLFCLSVRHCPLMLVASVKLRLITQAMSWYTFAGAYTRWRALVRFLDQQKSCLIPLNPVGLEDTAVMLLRPVTSYTTYAKLRKAKTPLLGYGGTILSEQLLWQNAGFYATDLNFQYLSLMVVWMFFVNFCS
jgi:hypothetical protein